MKKAALQTPIRHNDLMQVPRKREHLCKDMLRIETWGKKKPDRYVKVCI